MVLDGYTVGAFERGAPAWKESLWLVARFFLFLPAIPWPSALRVAALRAFGARIGSGVVIREGVNVSFPWRLQIGDHVWLGEGVIILSLAPVILESNVCLSQRAFLCTGSHNFQAPKFDLITKPITIHERSWVAADAFVAPGIEIGPDSMVSAGSVVLENVPPKTLVRGNPAKVVKQFG